MVTCTSETIQDKAVNFNGNELYKIQTVSPGQQLLGEHFRPLYSRKKKKLQQKSKMFFATRGHQLLKNSGFFSNNYQANIRNVYNFNKILVTDKFNLAVSLS